MYASTSQATVRKELAHYGIDSSSRAMSYRTVQVDNLLDLTQRKVRRQLGVALRDITSNDYSLTRAIGDWSRAQGYNGIIAPSARHQGGVNIVSFDGF